jgi:Zn-dependent protease with chaperone function
MARSCVQTSCDAKGQPTDAVICPACDHTTLPFIDTQEVDGIQRAEVSTGVFDMSNHDEADESNRTDVVVFETEDSRYAGSKKKLAARRRIQLAILFLTVALCIANGIAGRLPVLMTIGAILATQNIVVLIRMRKLNGPVVVDPEVQARIAAMLVELCARAGCVLPRVSIRRSPILAGVLIVRSRVSLIISPDVIERTDDDALRSILAHEVVHLSSGDTGRYRRRMRAISIVAYELGVAALFFIGHSSEIAWTLWLAFTPPGLRVVALLSGFTIRSRETNADVVGAEATGDPDAMIRGLRVVYALVDDVREVALGRPRLRWLLFSFAFRPTTHPPLEERIARLREISTTSSGATPTVG